MELSKKVLSEIVDNLDCGFKCYLNLKTGDVVEIPGLDQLGGDKVKVRICFDSF